MKLKGDLFVSRVSSAKRHNDGLTSSTIVADQSVNLYENAWYSLNATATPRAVELPDATTISPGWKVVIHNTSASATLNVKSFDGSFTGTLLKAIPAPVGVNDTSAYQFVLITNGTAAGVWYVVEIGDPARLRATRFVADFLVADWPAAVSGYRTLTSTQTAGLGAVTHDRGASPQFLVFETSAGPVYDRLLLDQERTDASGNVTLRIIDGDQFDGRVILV